MQKHAPVRVIQNGRLATLIFWWRFCGSKQSPRNGRSHVVQAVGRVQHQRRHPEVLDGGQRGHVSGGWAGRGQLDPGQKAAAAPAPPLGAPRPAAAEVTTAAPATAAAVDQPLGWNHALLILGLTTEEPTVGHCIGLSGGRGLGMKGVDKSGGVLFVGGQIHSLYPFRINKDA